MAGRGNVGGRIACVDSSVESLLSTLANKGCGGNFPLWPSQRMKMEVEREGRVVWAQVTAGLGIATSDIYPLISTAGFDLKSIALNSSPSRQRRLSVKSQGPKSLMAHGAKWKGLRPSGDGFVKKRVKISDVGEFHANFTHPFHPSH